jgi:hypothetical protein
MTQTEAFLSKHGLVPTVEMLLAGPRQQLGMSEDHAAAIVKLIERILCVPEEITNQLAGMVDRLERDGFGGCPG